MRSSDARTLRRLHRARAQRDCAKDAPVKHAEGFPYLVWKSDYTKLEEEEEALTRKRNAARAERAKLEAKVAALKSELATLFEG